MARRFHPNRRASMDQAPGPMSARAAPSVPKRMWVNGSAECENIFHASTPAVSVPATGVHRPITRSNPAAITTAHSTAR
jgi:hypothetical protein